jgi:signal transduction histidine kinase/Flp pilus assembly protein TadD
MFAQQEHRMLDSLKALLPAKQVSAGDTNKVLYFNALSFAYRLYSKEPQQAVQYAETARLLAKQLEYTFGEAVACHNLGLAYFAESQYAKALEAHEQAYSLRSQLGDKKGMSRSLSGKGLILQQQGNYDGALETYFQALQKGEEARDTTGLAVVYDNIGTVYRMQEKFEQSLDFHEKALSLHRMTGVQTNIAYSLMGKGSSLATLRRFEDALAAYNEALIIRKQNSHQIGIATTLNAIGMLHFRRGELVKAEMSHNQAAHIQENIGDKNGLAVSYYELGQVFEAMKQPERAFTAGAKALETARNIGAKTLVYQSGFLLARVSKDLGRSNEALLYTEQAITVKDSVVSEQKAQRIAELETRYELTSKQQQIELLAKDNALQTTSRNSLIVGIVLLLGLIGVGLVRFREKKRANAEILRQQVILEEQAREIEIMNIELQTVNQALNDKNVQLISLDDEKNEFLGIAAHDLKNPLGSIKLLSEVLNEYGEVIKEQRVVEMSGLIKKSAEQMLEMTTNLLDINAIEQGKVHFDIHRLNLSQTLREIVQMNQYRADAKNISIEILLPNTSVYAFADENALMQIIENLLSNAVKYSPLGTSIKASVSAVSSALLPSETIARIAISDEGPGLTNEDKRKLFGKFARLSAQPTAGEHSTGLGLSIVKRMVEQMNGYVFCESQQGSGATFIVELPLA